MSRVALPAAAATVALLIAGSVAVLVVDTESQAVHGEDRLLGHSDLVRAALYRDARAAQEPAALIAPCERVAVLVSAVRRGDARDTLADIYCPENDAACVTAQGAAYAQPYGNESTTHYGDELCLTPTQAAVLRAETPGLVGDTLSALSAANGLTRMYP